MFHDQDDDDSKIKIDQTSILSSFKAAVERTVQDTTQIEVSVPIATMVANAPQEKTLKEIIEERETDLKELE